VSPYGRSPVAVLGPTSYALSANGHVYQLLETTELVRLEVEGDLPRLLQKGNGGQELVSSYLSLSSEGIRCAPWTFSYNAFGNRSLHLYPQIAEGALLSCVPRTACINFDFRQLHRFLVWLREYFIPNSYAVHVPGGDQNLADLYSGPFSSKGEA